MDSPSASAAAILSSKGAKLHTHQMHIRRSANKKYIVEHELADKNGQPPQDGQSATAEHTVDNIAELQAHVGQHMQPLPEAQDAEPPQAGA
jgi:hypothetical protein